MTIDRELWKKPFTKDNFPLWICSCCNTGVFEIEKDKFHSVFDGSTERVKSHPAFDPDWVSLRFCGILRCNNKNCLESASISGTGVVKEEVSFESIEPELNYIEYFTPEYCFPPPAIFKIPEKTPEDVATEIIQSFSIFFSQAGSAGNKIRNSIEKLLDHQRIKKTTLNKIGKRVSLSLHQRIIEYDHKNSDLSKNILAIKWIGNSASHTRGLDIDDIFDAYDLLSHVLTEIYDNRSHHIKRITEKRNRDKK
jgi:hypothetical protein